MAVNGHTMSNAEITLVFEAGRKRPLNWAYVRFADPGEERQYIQVPPTCSLGGVAQQMNVVEHEFQPYQPFPIGPARRSTNPGSDEAKGGPHGIHFYGSI